MPIQKSVPKCVWQFYSLTTQTGNNQDVLQWVNRWTVICPCGGMHACVCAKSLQSCPTLCNPMDCSLPGSSVHRILQAGILEWVAISYSKGPSKPRDRTWVCYVSCIGTWIHYLCLGSRFSGYSIPKHKRVRLSYYNLRSWKNNEKTNVWKRNERLVIMKTNYWLRK